MTGMLSGRGALITGASRGLGLEIAKAYAREGASVVLCARDPEALDEARDAVTALATPGASVSAHAADVSVPADVERLVAAALEELPDLSILVNNAGVYGPKGRIEDVDWQAWTHAIAVNLHGSVLPCRALLPHLRARGGGKIVQLSGGGATAPLPHLSAYAASKAAVVRFVETLAGEVADAGIDVNAIAPGALNTRMLDEVLEAGPDAVGAGFYAKAQQQAESGGTPLEKGARLAVWLGSAASDGITGRLLSAVWDPYDDLPAHREELAGNDVYTLRRIVPADRALDWDE